MRERVRQPRDLARALGLALGYALTAAVGLHIEAVGGHATLVWPPAGIAVAVLLLAGDGVLPGIALGAFAINLYAGAPIWLALSIAFGNTLEAWLGAYALRRLTRFRRRLDGLLQVLGLIVLAALLSTLIAASVGSLGLVVASKVSAEAWGTAWRTWWVGDALGILVVAPLLLTLPERWRHTVSPWRWVEVVALSALLVLSCALVFLTESSVFLNRDGDLRAQIPGLPYLVFPSLIWAGIRFGLRGGARATFAVSAFAIYGTLAGRGPFVHETLGQSLLAVQIFVAVVAVTSLVLGAIVSDRTEAIRRREEFLAIVSHDLKNPLNAIMMSTEMLARLPSDQVGERAQNRIRIIRRSSERMFALIRDLLDIVAIEAGRLGVHLRNEDAGALLREAAEMMQPIASERAHVLTVALAPPAARVLCDRERVLQVFSNLIGNAVKFTPEGGKIAVAAELVGTQMRFSVADTGPGMTPKELAHIFDRFWRATPSSSGTGLGLSIAKGIIEAHGGSIWAESALGNGSRFYFTLQMPGADR